MKNTKTILFAFLITAMIITFSGIQSTSAEEVNPELVVEAHTPLGAPTNLIASAGNNTVTLSWTAPASDPVYPITDYTIRYSDNAFSSHDPYYVWTTLQTGNGTITSYTITGLTNDRHYIILLNAQNAIESSTVTRVTSIPNANGVANPTVPDAPTGLSLRTSSDGRDITLYWTAPYDGGAKVYLYSIMTRDSYTGLKQFAHLYDDAITSYTFTDIGSSHKHFFKINAHNLVGGSPTATIMFIPR